ncbi:MAG: hypothetical protein ACPGJV_01735 [Bacteriovoracaceae bacterium]
MNKLISLFLLSTLSLILTSCGSSNSDSNNSNCSSGGYCMIFVTSTTLASGDIDGATNGSVSGDDCRHKQQNCLYQP